MPIEILVRTILAGNSKSEYLLHENVASEKKLPVPVTISKLHYFEFTAHSVEKEKSLNLNVMYEWSLKKSI